MAMVQTKKQTTMKKYDLVIFADGKVRFEHEGASLIAIIAVMVAFKKKDYENVVITITNQQTEEDE